MASSTAQSPRIFPHDHRPSVSTVEDTAVSSGDESDTGSQYATPPPIEGGKAEPSTPEIPSVDGLLLDPGSDSDTDQPSSALTGSPRSKVRRSLHRTLRDSHGSSGHRRSFKGRDSGSTVVSEDTQESEGLSRRHGSFTVHGKKASVIQFGPDWHNAEERLKIRKQAQEAMQEGSADERDGSVISDGTATILATPVSKGSDDSAYRPSSSETRKQRHVSSQTITPASYQRSVNGHGSDSDTASEMSEIAEEYPKESAVKASSPIQHPPSNEEESGTERVNLPRTISQTVEA